MINYFYHALKTGLSSFLVYHQTTEGHLATEH